MTHEWVEGKLSAYLEDALDPKAREDVRAHLETCADCQVLLEDYRHDELLLRGLTAPDPDPEMAERFFASPEYVALKRRQENPPTPARVWLVRGAIPAAALIAVGLGVGLTMHARLDSGSSAHASQTPNTIGAPPSFAYPLAAGQRLIFLRGGILWSAPEMPDGSAATASAPDQLTPTNAQVVAWSVSPASNGTGGKLVAWIDGKTGQLHLVRADGLTDTVVTRIAPAGQAISSAALTSLVWSPDGSKLAFVSQDASGALTLHVLSVSGPDTATGAQLGASVTLGSLVGAPVWSANSQALAWATTNGDGSSSVWTLNAVSASQVASQADPHNAHATIAALGWSGNAVTWATMSGGQMTGVFAAIPGATGATRLTPDGAQYTAAALSAHGTWLLAGEGALWRIPANASAPTQAATLNGAVSHIIWSPDSKTAALISSSSNGTQIALWSPDAGLTSVTASAASDVTPAWSANAQSLAYVQNGKVIVALIQNGRVTTTATGAAITEPATLAWAADNASLAIIGPHGVYLTSNNGLLLTLITSYAPSSGAAAWSTAG